MTMKKYLDLFEAAPMPTGSTALPSATPSVTAKPATVKSVKPGDASAYVGGPMDATAQVPDTSKAIPGTQSKAVNNPMQDFEESIEEELAEMMRLSGMSLNEKAVSKQQQKFMGMVHAMQKGEKVKGASPELKKVAKTMGKKDAKDFASTKHAGLPKKVTEDVMLDEGGNALKHITNRFKHEVKNFMNSGVMADNLYDALYDYYLDTGEMPYGIAKAREGDPYAWVEERFYADMGSSMSEAAVTEEMGHHDTLSELARLAGLEEDGAGQFGMPTSRSMSAIPPKAVINKSVEPVSQFAADLEMPPLPFFSKKEKADYEAMKARKAERDFQQSGSTYKDDSGIIYDREGNPKVQPSLPTKDYLSKDSRARDLYNMQFRESVDLTECGDMDMDHEDSFNVSTNMSSDGTKDVTINARGDKADELLQMLKMAGMRPHDDHSVTMSEPEVIMIGGNDEMMDETGRGGMPWVPDDGSVDTEVDPEDIFNPLMDEAKKTRKTKYSNTPDEEYQSIKSITDQGNDLNRQKRQYASKPRLGDNPMAETTLDEDISALLDSVLIREFDDITKREEPYRDPKTGKMVTPPKGLSISEPVYPAAKTPKMEPPSILDREKPYRDPKSGRMITPPKGLSISEPVYGAPNITKAK